MRFILSKYFMLALVVPPILLVLALAFLVYFFSKRMPLLETRINQGEVVLDETTSSSPWRDRVKHALLSMLEKGVRRWKVGLLKAHNQAHQMTDNIRRHREASRERLLRSEEEKHAQEIELASSEEAEAPTASLEPMLSHPTLPTQGESLLRGRELSAEPVATFEPQPTEVSRHPARSASRLSPRRPMQRRAPVRGTEEESAPAATKEQLEALLIERIVTNPKDIEAYERLGDYYLEQGSLTDAKECYRQVLKLSPVNRLVKIKIRRLERVLENRERV